MLTLVTALCCMTSHYNTTRLLYSGTPVPHPVKVMAVDHTIRKVVGGPFGGPGALAKYNRFAAEYVETLHTHADVEAAAASHSSGSNNDSAAAAEHTPSSTIANSDTGATPVAETPNSVETTAAADSDDGGAGDDDDEVSMGAAAGKKMRPISAVLLQFLLGTCDEESPLSILGGCSDVLELIWMEALELYGADMVIGDGLSFSLVNTRRYGNTCHTTKFPASEDRYETTQASLPSTLFFLDLLGWWCSVRPNTG